MAQSTWHCGTLPKKVRLMLFRFGSQQVTVNIPDRSALLAEVRARLTGHAGFALATLNLDHLVKLRRSAAFRSTYAAQDLVVADGNPIVWLSHLARRPVALVPGSDLVIPLARLAAATGATVALIGSTDIALAAAADRLRAEVPGVIIALTHAPAMGFDPQGAEARALLARVAPVAGLCFIALGAPKQETFAALGRSLAPGVGFVSVGAGLDFLAGTQGRAPKWVRSIAMEWLWRALSEPRRLIPRYLACVAILPGQMLEAWRLRSS